jgi:flagellar capping protein FliD
MLTSYTGTNGIMSTLTDGSATQLQSLQDNQKSAQTLLDARYTAMTAQFVQYDTIMTNLTNQFASLKQQINSTGTTTG